MVQAERFCVLAEPPEGALQQLHKLYAWGLDELTTQYAQRLRDEASLMRQTQGDKVDRLSRVISEIADNAAYEVGGSNELF